MPSVFTIRDVRYWLSFPYNVLVICDQEFRFFFFSPRMAELFGWYFILPSSLLLINAIYSFFESFLRGIPNLLFSSQLRVTISFIGPYISPIVILRYWIHLLRGMYYLVHCVAPIFPFFQHLHMRALIGFLRYIHGVVHVFLWFVVYRITFQFLFLPICPRSSSCVLGVDIYSLLLRDVVGPYFLSIFFRLDFLTQFQYC